MNNWKIHFWWTVSFGVLLLITVITYWLGGKGNDMVSYVSFASALISIVLALVAIFYSMIQNTSSQQNIVEMKTLIEQASALMAEKAGAITDEAKAMRETGLAIIAKFQPLPDVGGVSEPLEGQSFQLNISKAASPFLFILHCLVKSYERRKRILPEKIVKQIYKKLNPIFNFSTAIMAFAMISVLRYFFEDGSIVIHELPGNRLPEIEVKNLPANFTEYVSKEIKNRIKEDSTTEETKPTFKEGIQAIDDYFKN